MAEYAVVMEEGYVIENFGGEGFYLVPRGCWLEGVSEFQQCLEGRGEVVQACCLSELVLICWVQELVAEGDGKGGAKEAPAFRNGQLSERGAGYGRALSGCRFCGSCKSGDKEWLAAEECVAEVVASGLVLWGEGWDLVGGEGVEGSGCRSVVIDHDEECGVHSSEGRW